MLGNIAEKIFRMKYSLRGEEDWNQTCIRVAQYISSVEKEDRDQWFSKFYQMLFNRAFIPGGRTLANAGTDVKNLNNCFVLPIGDSRQEIYQTLKDAAEIFAWGGGIGYNFSKIREKGSPVLTTGGNASGPLSFMSLFDQTGEVISQASRRGAQISLLNIDHPDIENFIDFKSKLIDRNKRVMEEYVRNLHKVGLDSNGRKYFKVLEKTLQDDQLTHFNISVALTDDFMRACIEDKDWDLNSRIDNSVCSVVKAKDLLMKIAEMAWESGDPGVFFYDRVNEDNIVKHLGYIEATNPCVSGDTKILTVFEGAKTFKELADSGKDILVYSWSPETKLPVVRMMRNPRLTRKNAKCVEITFDSGLKVKCTLDHNFYTFRGNRIKAEDLNVGQSIRAFSMSKHRDGHLRVHGWGKNNKAKHQYVARLVYECFNGIVINKRNVLHHKDFNPLNNQLENLELITPEWHNSIHYESRRANGFYHRNHKVINISSPFNSDVYNGTVDETHTYIIADDIPIAGIYSGIVSANCGEIPLLPYEACCLGSINLHSTYDEETKSINFPFLEELIRTAIRFMDNMQELSTTPVENVNKWCKGLRRLGLGVMGWADLLAELEIPYDSEDAFKLANYLSWFISFFSLLESMNLVHERGAFEFYDKNKVDLSVVDKTLHSPYQKNRFDLEAIRENGLRNVATTSIAPTGTIALIAEVNSSIEPFFALAYKRNITEGVGNIAKDYVIEINPILFKKLKAEGFSDEELGEIKEIVQKTGSIQEIPKISDKTKAIFKIAGEINWAEHIFMQAAWQEFVNNSISKTINMDESVTPDDIYKAYLLMWNSGLKGGTVYRNNSKTFQILEKGIK